MQATYNVKQAGAVTLTVQLLEADGSLIQQRTFNLTCKPGKPSPAHFELLWTQKPLIAGEATAMEVVCKDAYQNLLDQLPGWELWSVFMQQVCMTTLACFEGLSVQVRLPCMSTHHTDLRGVV